MPNVLTRLRWRSAALALLCLAAPGRDRRIFSHSRSAAR
jgi:hypothetical protein